MGITPLAAVLVKPSGRGRDYLAAGDYPEPDSRTARRCWRSSDVEPPDEPIHDRRYAAILVPLYGLTRFRDLFTPRQLATLCAFAQGVSETHDEMRRGGMEPQRAEAVCAYLGLALDRVADRSSTLCRGTRADQKAQSTRLPARRCRWCGTSPRPIRSAAPRETPATTSTDVADIVEELARRSAGASRSSARPRPASRTTTTTSTRSSPIRRTTTTSPTPTSRTSSTSGSSDRSASSSRSIRAAS